MKKNFYDLLAYYGSKEKFWLNAFAETGSQRFFKRAMKYKSKAEVLQAFGRGHALGYSLKQINSFQNRAHELAERQLSLFENERGDSKLSYMSGI